MKNAITFLVLLITVSCSVKKEIPYERWGVNPDQPRVILGVNDTLSSNGSWIFDRDTNEQKQLLIDESKADEQYLPIENGIFNIDEGFEYEFGEPINLDGVEDGIMIIPDHADWSDLLYEIPEQPQPGMIKVYRDNGAVWEYPEDLNESNYEDPGRMFALNTAKAAIDAYGFTPEDLGLTPGERLHGVWQVIWSNTSPNRGGYEMKLTPLDMPDFRRAREQRQMWLCNGKSYFIKMQISDFANESGQLGERYALYKID